MKYEPADESGYMSIGTQLDTDSKKIGLLIKEVPPIIIHLSSPADEAKKISLWLGNVLHHEMDRVVDLYFCHDVFSHEMLKRAIRLAQHIGDTMDNIMKLMILEIVMSHQICIFDDAKAALQKKVSELILEQGIAVSTRMINKLVKSVTVVISSFLLYVLRTRQQWLTCFYVRRRGQNPSNRTERDKLLKSF
jgi:hypothetical protein